MKIAALQVIGRETHGNTIRVEIGGGIKHGAVLNMPGQVHQRHVSRRDGLEHIILDIPKEIMKLHPFSELHSGLQRLHHKIHIYHTVFIHRHLCKTTPVLIRHKYRRDCVQWKLASLRQHRHPGVKPDPNRILITRRASYCSTPTRRRSGLHHGCPCIKPPSLIPFHRTRKAYAETCSDTHVYLIATMLPVIHGTAHCV